jgi:hypothetical protein
MRDASARRLDEGGIVGRRDARSVFARMRRTLHCLARASKPTRLAGELRR